MDQIIEQFCRYVVPHAFDEVEFSAFNVIGCVATTIRRDQLVIAAMKHQGWSRDAT